MNMTGSAKTWLNLHKASFTSWENIKIRLIQDFSLDANKEELRRKLNRMQHWNEPTIRFAEDILVLCNKVDSAMEEGTKIEHVIGGLKKEYSFELYLNSPKTTDDLLVVCKKMDSFEKKYRERVKKSRNLYNGPRYSRPQQQSRNVPPTSTRNYQTTSRPQAPVYNNYKNDSPPTPRQYRNNFPQPSTPRRPYNPNLCRNQTFRETPTIKAKKIFQGLISTLQLVEKLDRYPLRNKRKIDSVESDETSMNVKTEAGTQVSNYVVQHLPRNPSIFSGEDGEDLQKWLKRYARVARYNHWDETLCLTKVYFYLSGTALKWFENNEESIQTWKEFTSQLENVFGKKENSKLQAEKKLKTRAQLKGESTECYIQDLLCLCKEVDPQMSEEDKISHLMKGIAEELYQALLPRDVQSTEQFITECRRVEALRCRRVTPTRYERLPNVASLCDQDDGEDLSSMIRQIVREEVQRALGSPREEPKNATIEEIVKEEIGRTLVPISKSRRSPPQKEKPRQFLNTRYEAETIRPHPEPRYPKQGGRRDTNDWRTTEGRPICFYCGRPGHVVRYCRDRKRHNEERRNDYFQRKQDTMVSYNSRAESQDPNDESSRKTFTRYRSSTSYRGLISTLQLVKKLDRYPFRKKRKIDSVEQEETTMTIKKEATNQVGSFFIQHLPRNPSMFSGEGSEDPHNWLKKYERVAKHNQWDETLCLANVYFYLTGTALKWFENNEESILTWTEFMSQLKSVFGKNENLRLRAEKTLKTRAQLKGESTEFYIQDVLRLCKEVDPHMNEQDKISHLMKGIAEELYQALLPRDAHTTQQFVTECRRIEALHCKRVTPTRYERLPNVASLSDHGDRADLSSMIRQIVREEVQRALASPREEPEISAIEHMVQQEIEKTIAPISRSVPQNRAPRPLPSPRYEFQPRNFQPRPQQPKQLNGRRDTNEWRTTEGKPICFHCGRPGHVVRYCRDRRREYEGEQTWNYKQRDRLEPRTFYNSRSSQEPNDDLPRENRRRYRSPSPHTGRKGQYSSPDRRASQSPRRSPDDTLFLEKCLFEDTPKNSSPLYSELEYRIEPASIQLIEVASRDIPNDAIVVAECRKELLLERELTAPSSVISLTNNRGKLWVVNWSPYPKLIPQGMHVADSSVIEYSQLCTLADCNQVETEAEHSEDPKTSEFFIGHSLDESQKEKLRNLLKNSTDIFEFNKRKQFKDVNVKHRINTGDHLPTKQRPYRVAPRERQIIQDEVNKMEKLDIIQPSESPWASPVVLIRKKDGSWRFCVDYRRLNKITKKDVYPLPRIDDTLDCLRGARFYSSMDLQSGYWQIDVEESDREKTAFITPDGLYEFKVMPFGLCNAPATFERMIDNLLKGLKWTICLCYLDDIIVFSDGFEEHLRRLQLVLNCLKKAGLCLNSKKCKFGAKTITVLGHEVSENGIRPDQEKIRAVRDFATPRSLKEVRSFLGLSSYYRRFIPNYAHVAQPLNDLLRKDSEFNWNQEEQNAFEALKTVRKYVAHCSDCQRRKHQPQLPSGHLQPIPVPEVAFEKVGMDLLGRFPTSEGGNRWIIVCTDYLTKYAIPKALPTSESMEVAKFFIEDVILKHGAPRELITDRGRNFTSSMISDLNNQCRITHRKTTAYHPQTNGLTERLNKTIADMLSMYVDVNQKDWDRILPFVTFAYNTAKQESTGFTPFFFVHGREAETPLDVLFPKLLPEDDDFIQTLGARAEEARKLARIHSMRSQDSNKQRYDAHPRNIIYQPGDLVWIFIPVRKVGYSEKLMRRYFGPYKVTRKISDVTYEVETFGNQQGRRKTKDLVHICRMKPYLNPEDQEDHLEEDPEDDSTNFQEEDIPTERTQQPQTRVEISGPITRSRALRLR
ncbi:hypothetical protein LAZ67_5002180, partial [Cordylochernes scorpioides]